MPRSTSLPVNDAWYVLMRLLLARGCTCAATCARVAPGCSSGSPAGQSWHLPTRTVRRRSRNALTFRAKFAVKLVAATSGARAARAASSRQQGQKQEQEREQAQQEEEETASKCSELRQARATLPQQADDINEDDEDDGDDDKDKDDDTPPNSADLLSRARHIVGSYIDNAESGILLTSSTREGLQLLSTRSSYVSWRCVALRGVVLAWCGVLWRGVSWRGVAC